MCPNMPPSDILEGSTFAQKQRSSRYRFLDG
jgi:hypothetical protein